MFDMNTSKALESYFTNADKERLDIMDKAKQQRDRTNESYLYVSPAHKAKLKAYTRSTRRTMRAELEVWIDSLPTSD